MSKRIIGAALFLGYVAVIFAANWAIARFGFVPVGFGLLAPAGVYFAGAAYELRDLVQDTLGRRFVLLAIVIGAGISYFISPPQIALASGAAFMLGEFADFAIYTPMRRRFWLVAMLVANPVGDFVDSAVFLLIAFHSLHFITGQVVGKAWLTWVPVGILWLGRTLWRARQQRFAAA